MILQIDLVLDHRFRSQYWHERDPARTRTRKRGRGSIGVMRCF
ncbi:hypothetical protein RISK_006709 [Rhodopirellula islandica]|uniref:Uncharacterized protein n=1 Tax=Rhodopirellula islandica TaxID=595434 RepID=A0A0J1B2J4_RHOIS|nr:hypothetical protein RISK_006709 [Rhodopirellula islandica]